MNKQLEIWQFINKSLLQNVPVMLLYVLESKGSSPGRQGFFMAVNAVGEMEGSVGGGIMEHKFAEMAKRELKQNETEISVRRQVHDKSAAKNQSGMICSGEQTILLYRMQPDEVTTVQNIISCLKKNEIGLLQLSPSGLSFLAQVLPGQDFLFWYQSAQEWLYQEKTGYKNHLYIIGGGHCALAFSRIMYGMDFYIHLFDDRPGLNTLEQNNCVHEKSIVHDYSELKELVPSGDHHYVVIMTFGYRTDDIALRALLHKDFKYLGLLGSSYKIKKMFAGYVAEGIDEKWLKKIHAPVGLPIHSQTTEEIAVSIAAEIIQIKNKNK
jgi:xanthine dehydrogenase accessory factor